MSFICKTSVCFVWRWGSHWKSSKGTLGWNPHLGLQHWSNALSTLFNLDCKADKMPNIWFNYIIDLNFNTFKIKASGYTSSVKKSGSYGAVFLSP